MADPLKISRLDYPVGDTLKIGQSDMKEIATELLKMSGTKYGSLAEVIFTVGNADGSMYNISGSEMGFSASNTLTGVSKTEVVNKNITLQNKDAASIKDIKNFAAQLGIIQASKTVGNYALSNFGNWSQDPLVQAEINNLRTGFSPFANIAVGAKVGGWVGAIAAAVAEGTRFGLNALDRHIELERSNINSQINFARAGINTRTSGGR